MSSASADGSEYNPDRNRQHEEEEGSPPQAQSSRAAGRGKTSKASQQAGKQPKGQSKEQLNSSNMPPLPPNYAGYPPQSLGASAQTDDEQARADRQRLYALLRQQVSQGLPQGGPNANYDIGPQQGATSGTSFAFPIMHPIMEQIPPSHPAEAPPDAVSTETSPSNRKDRPEPGSEEWQRMRKDNHKEVERRRRGNINDGINELARLLPSSNGDKAKGAILQRAVAYMSQLKDNEARSIEKWTIEKMMMDKSMEEVHMRLEVCEKKLADAERRAAEERKKRMELEVELIDLRRGRGGERGGGSEADRPNKRQRLD